jgi:uracil-DNA glycosylase
MEPGMEAIFTKGPFKELICDLCGRIASLESAGKKICPAPDERFRAFLLTPIERVKVVILGQDPYHGDGQANGLAFSVSKDSPIPPSLKNIYKELYEDLGIALLKAGDLSSWASQGVLLLNTILTVEEGKPLSHKDLGWQKIISLYLEELLSTKKPLAICLWGKEAQKFFHPLQKFLSSKQILFCAAHPSPLSAHRGFFGSKPFSKINAFLKQEKLDPIVWESVGA